MPAVLVETIEQFVYAGAVSPGGLIAIGTVAAVILALLAWRDRRVGRGWLIPVLALLRLPWLPRLVGRALPGRPFGFAFVVFRHNPVSFQVRHIV